MPDARYPEIVSTESQNQPSAVVFPQRLNHLLHNTGCTDDSPARCISATLNFSTQGHVDSENHAQGSLASVSSPLAVQAPTRKRARPEGSRVEATYPRKRAITACRLCRARKVKCNNARPVCGNCEASKGICVYDDNQDISSFDPASILILEKLDKVLTRLDLVENLAHLPQVLNNVSSATPTDTRQEAANEVPCFDTRGRKALGEESHVEDCDFDQLRIPTSRTTADTVLQWPIFDGCYPPNYLIDAVFMEDDLDDNESSMATAQGSNRLHNRGAVLEEDTVIELVKRFLDLVYPKNPILDVELLWSYTENILEAGLKWDAPSCLVLLACALGCVAVPFPREQDPSIGTTSLKAQERDLREGAAYYNLAKRRLGMSEMGILSSQCHFLAGVYNMYVMRPLISWSHFQSATKAYHLHLQRQSRRLPQQQDDNLKTSQDRNLEQRLYWSCYKSECELRAEMNLPNSSLVDVHNSNMHPSPPEISRDEMSSSPMDGSPWSRANARTPSATHQQREQTWFYYLTEISLRRIANRVLNILYPGDHSSWTKEAVLSMVNAVEHFEQQLDEWHATLPAPLRFESSDMADKELPYHVRSRILQIKAWIYTPFLYYALHMPADAAQHDCVGIFADKAISSSLTIMRSAPTAHRHHGTWFSIQQITSCCLFVIGAARRGNVHVPAGWKYEVESAIGRMRYWEDEGPGVSRVIQVLTGYLLDAPTEPGTVCSPIRAR